MSDTHRLYLKDLGYLIKERALEAKKDYENSSEDEKEFASGVLATYTNVINMMLNQASSFNIDEKDICLDSFEPEKKLYE